jgi:hypothetical protein
LLLSASEFSRAKGRQSHSFRKHVSTALST